MMPQNINTIGIILNPRKKQVVNSLNALAHWIDETKPAYEFLICTYHSAHLNQNINGITETSESELLQRSDAIITLGGDGTILRAVHVIQERQIPVLGINLGGLGFLAETPPEHFLTDLVRFLNGDYVIDERSTLKCEIVESSSIFHALNDIVIDKAGFSRVIEIVTYVDDSLLNTYIADALIISTPTGSTGYSLSAGGPIVIPNTQVMMINPICPHSLTNRPVIIPDNSAITLTVNTEHNHFNLLYDGQLGESLRSGMRIRISRGSFNVRLVRMNGKGFHDTLRSKLHWGEDFRDKNRWSYNESESG
jgi:NAD+ kinase